MSGNVGGSASITHERAIGCENRVGTSANPYPLAVRQLNDEFLISNRTTFGNCPRDISRPIAQRAPVNQVPVFPTNDFLARNPGDTLEILRHVRQNAVAILLKNPSPLNRYFGQDKLDHPAAPIVCVPTTAGTASEVTRYSVIIDSQANIKKTIAAESIIPRLALLDAQLTLALPSDLTAQTGMDAFSHAIEAYLSTAGNLLCDCFCLQALEMITQALPAVLAEPKNINLRHEMLLASMLAGLALNSAGTILNHGMAYTLTIRYGLGHGLANALLLPYTISYIAEDYPEKISRFCRILDCEDVEIGLLNFNQRLNIPTSLAKAGVQQDDLQVLAQSCQLNCTRALPRMKRQMDLHDYTQILQRAFG